MNNSGCTCRYNSLTHWCCKHLYRGMAICVRVFGMRRVMWERKKGFNGGCIPVCVVVCRINRPQLWFILYSQCKNPFYLTGKVKAYSLEAVLQRSTCSLGMRNRTMKRERWRRHVLLFSPLFALLTASNVLKTHTVLFARNAQQYVLYPLLLSFLSPLSPLCSSYLCFPVIPPISHVVKIADLE